MNIGVIVASAGQSKRLGHNKVLMELRGKPVLLFSLEKFIKLSSLSELVIVIRPQDEEDVRNILSKAGISESIVKIIHGGKERQDSVYRGLMALTSSDIVMVHDGARPFISYELIVKLIEEVEIHPAVIPALPVKETIKVVKDGYVESTLKRELLWSVQTPQVFRYKILLEAYEKAYQDKFYGTDDASLVERLGYKIRVIEGEYTNLKITTKEDLLLAHRYLELLGI
ncbi:MAG: 2-C-methyl-D-erythritol 4-phosphate cytidylyltransferase [bacterium]